MQRKGGQHLTAHGTYNIRYFFVKDKIDNNELHIEYLPTEEMVADVLTKSLQGELFKRLRNKSLNCEE